MTGIKQKVPVKYIWYYLILFLSLPIRKDRFRNVVYYFNILPGLNISFAPHWFVAVVLSLV